MLPELDGRAVIRAVRRDDEAAATPILILSARGSTLDRIAGLEDGADDYLPKPFSPGRARPARQVDPAPDATRRGRPTPSAPRRRPLVHWPTSSSTSTATRSRRDGEPIPLTRVEFRLLQPSSRPTAGS